MGRTKGPQSVSAAAAQVLIVEDHELMRDGLRWLIKKESDLEICGEAVDEASARQLIVKSMVDVAIVDLTLDGGSGLELIKWIAQHRPKTKTIVSTMHNEQIYGPRALRAGARGYVNKHDPAQTILIAIRRVLAGKMFFSEELAERMMNVAAIQNGVPLSQSPMDKLSNRELQIFRRIGEGLTTDQIAHCLHLSANTISTYRERLKTKLDLKSAAELTHVATLWVAEDS